MSKSRDLIYLNAYPNENRIVSCGIEFKEFMTALENHLDNILVLAGYFDEGEFDYTTRCNFIREEIIPNIINTDVYKFGDFVGSILRIQNHLEPLSPGKQQNYYILGT